jgi:hypothetical protein
LMLAVDPSARSARSHESSGIWSRPSMPDTIRRRRSGYTYQLYSGRNPRLGTYRKRTKALSPQIYTISSFTRCPGAPFCP